MKAITYQLHLLEPILISQVQSGEENSAVGFPFVPGSVLRGALAHRYLKTHSLNDPSIDTGFRRFFLDGTVCYLNAYPLREDIRLLPRPLSWFTEKDMADSKDAIIYDWAVDPNQHLDRPKGPEGEFCLLIDTAVVIDSPPRQINVHITLQNPNRRGEENQVFRYDALAAGQTLSGAIVAPDNIDLTVVGKLMEPAEIFMGKARLAGYGRARFATVSLEEDWKEVEPGYGLDSSEVVVTLLSDAILRGANGQVGGDLSAVLARLAGMATTPKPRRAYQHLHLVAGFNRKWSLPLVQDWAIQAGSVFVYSPGSFDPDALADVIAHGIGERRAEGFGRLAVNWQTEPELQRREVEAGLFDIPDLSEDSKDLARQMASRRLRNLLDRSLAEAVNNTRFSGRLPKNTQLSRVRAATQSARQADSMKPVLDHLQNLKGARQQFERARIGERTSMLAWIEERATTLDVHTQLLKGATLPEVAGQPAELSEALRVEYTARLIDGVMKKAVKENQL